MFHVRRRYDAPGPRLGDSVPIGDAGTVDELHELLREGIGTYIVTSDDGDRPVRLELEAPVGDDRAFVDLIANATRGHGPAELVSH